MFVAIEIPDEIKKRLERLIEHLNGTTRGARWIRADALHLTLKFIGEMPKENLPAIEGALASVHNSAPVEAQIRGTGFFPNDRHPHVFWVGMDASSNLKELAAAVDASLKNVGVPPETREFSPHLTLARFKGRDGLSRLREAIRNHETTDFGSMRASEFHLFRSELLPDGARHTRLASFPFVEARS